MATTFMFVDPAQKNFLDAMAELFKNQIGTDAVLVCQGPKTSTGTCSSSASQVQRN